MSKIPHGRDTHTGRPCPCTYDDVLTAFDETWYRWVAYRRAVADAGPDPDEEMFLALVELQFAADHWRERFVAALARRGLTVGDVLGTAA